MGKSLGLDRDTARQIKRMNTKELDRYLTRVTSRSYDNGYEEGLINGIALSGQALDKALEKFKDKGVLEQLGIDEIKRGVGEYIANTAVGQEQIEEIEAAEVKVVQEGGTK
ncbi:MAG: hypothetical protein ACERKZ_03350 [Lachnotalea sp.]